MATPILNIDDSHQLFLKTKIPLLLGNKIQEDNESATIFVPNAFAKEGLLEKKQEIQSALSKPFTVIIDERQFKPIRKQRIQQTGIVSGMQPSPVFTGIPFILSDSNKTAHTTAEAFVEGKYKGVFFVYGASGCGKTHLMHLMAKDASEKGFNVYLNSTEGFLSSLKEHYERKTTNISSQYTQNNFFILDDFQIMHRDYTRGFWDSFFDILNSLILEMKNVCLASDVPLGTYNLLPERIISRLRMGFVSEVKLPDAELKRKFIDYYTRLNGIELPEKFVDPLIHSSNSLRDVIGGINLCRAENGAEGMVHLSMFIEKLRQIHGSSMTTSGFNKAYLLLSEYFGVSAQKDEKKAAKKSVKTTTRRDRNESSMNSILYFLFYGRVGTNVLREKLAISRKNHTHYLNIGEKRYGMIKDAQLKAELESLRTNQDNLNLSLFGDGEEK